MATNKFEAYTGGIYLEHHYFTLVSITVLCSVMENSQSSFTLTNVHGSAPLLTQASTVNRIGSLKIEIIAFAVKEDKRTVSTFIYFLKLLTWTLLL